MILVVLFIGAIILVAALRGTQGQLFGALEQDVPAFVVWAAAILALGAIGFIPGLKPISRGLMSLVLIVIVLRNYQNIIKGFQTVSVAPSTSGTTTGSSSTATNSAPAPIAGTTGSEEGAPLTVQGPGNLQDDVSTSNSFGGSGSVSFNPN